MSNLGTYLGSRYDRTGNLQDLQAAINYAERSMETVQDNHPDRAARLKDLSGHLGRQYEWSGNLQDLEAAAINHAEAAVNAKPEDLPHRAARLTNLSSHLGSQYERTGIWGTWRQLSITQKELWRQYQSVTLIKQEQFS